MGRRYYRRRSRNSAGALIRDSVQMGNRLPWWGAALMGLLLFLVFYWLLPLWLQSLLESTGKDNPLITMLQQVFERRIHWVEYLGIVFGLIGLFFTIKNYFFTFRITKHGEAGVGFFARIFGRFFN
jgi:predicted MFS family arabinose efflux permease